MRLKSNKIAAMEMEANYFRKDRHYCGKWNNIGFESFRPDSDNDMLLFEPSIVKFYYDIDEGISNVVVENDPLGNISAFLKNRKEFGVLNTRMPIVLLDGQVLELTSGNFSVDLSLHSEQEEGEMNQFSSENSELYYDPFFR